MKRRAASRKRAAKKSTRAIAKSAKRGARKSAKPKRPNPIVAHAAAGARTKVPHLNRERRTLSDTESLPSSLNFDQHGSAARTGRIELEEALQEHTEASPAITAGDVDANWEQAYFSGDEAPGGDNPTPDQEVVEDIGRALGVEYEDNEELKSTDKVVRRDKHRWELDPASAEDYKERK